jgi:hypothetical protein
MIQHARDEVAEICAKSMGEKLVTQGGELGERDALMEA